MVIGLVFYLSLDQAVIGKEGGKDIHSVSIVWVYVAVTSDKDKAIFKFIFQIINTVTKFWDLIKEVYFSSRGWHVKGNMDWHWTARRAVHYRKEASGGDWMNWYKLVKWSLPQDHSSSSGLGFNHCNFRIILVFRVQLIWIFTYKGRHTVTKIRDEDLGLAEEDDIWLGLINEILKTVQVSF